MENEHAEKYTDIRYSKMYAILTICLALFMIAIGIIYYFNIIGAGSIVFILLFLIGGLILLFAGMTLRRRTYFRIDKQNQIVTIYGTIGFFTRKYPYDRIYLEDKELYIEKNGKKKLLSILHYAYDKGDFNAFREEITK